MYCPNCGTRNAAGARFCTSCGTQLASGAPPAPATTEGQPAPAAQTAEPQGQPNILRQISEERTGIVPTIAVFIVAAAVSWILWIPLSVPPRLVNAIVPDPRLCTNVTPGTTGMYLCSSRVALVTLAGPLIVMVGMFLLRRQIMGLTRNLVPRLPEETAFIAAPLVATMLFVIPWAGVHYQTSSLTGILPQKIFPAVIGVFTFAVVRFGPVLQEKLTGFFDFRDRFPQVIKLGIAILIPIVFAFLITRQDRVTETALKEQFIVVLSLCVGFLVLTPRSGDIVAGAKQFVGGEERRAAGR